MGRCWDLIVERIPFLSDKCRFLHTRPQQQTHNPTKSNLGNQRVFRIYSQNRGERWLIGTWEALRGPRQKVLTQNGWWIFHCHIDVYSNQSKTWVTIIRSAVPACKRPTRSHLLTAVLPSEREWRGSSDSPLRFRLLLKPFVCNHSLTAGSLSFSATLIEVLTLIFQLTKDVEHFFKCFLAILCQMFTSCIFWEGGEIMGHALIFCRLWVSSIGVGMVLLNRKGVAFSWFPS